MPTINKKFISSLLMFFIFLFIINSFIYQFRFFNKINSNILLKDDYAQPLNWLKKNTKPNSVVLANDDLSRYIPLLTNNYILFNHYVGFHVMADYEVEERYLVSRVFSGLDKNDLKVDFRKYAGVGNAIHKANLINRKTKVCLIFKNISGFLKCSNFVDSYSLKGERYFDSLMERYFVIKKNSEKYLSMYGVDYVLIDKKNDTWVLSNNFKLVFDNGVFEIYIKE